VTRLLLVAHGLNASLRRVEFGGTADLDPSGRLDVAPSNDVGIVLSGPAPACRQTATAFGVPVEVVDALADCDYGRWTGRTLAEVSAAEPEAVAAWLADPSAAPHGGESADDLVRRAGSWLDGLTADRVVAVTHAAVVRAVLGHALAVPFWQVDVEPLGAVRLDRRDGRWRLHFGGVMKGALAGQKPPQERRRP
jgi:broad specificity phosphatase PhoE